MIPVRNILLDKIQLAFTLNLPKALWRKRTDKAQIWSRDLLVKCENISLHASRNIIQNVNSAHGWTFGSFPLSSHIKGAQVRLYKGRITCDHSDNLL